MQSFSFVGSLVTDGDPSIELYIGGYFGARINIRIKKNQGLYSSCSGDETDLKTKIFTVDDAALMKFINRCKEIGAFTWDKEYIDSHALDGDCWSVKIKVGNDRIDSSGGNAYPKNFRKFKSIVKELVGHEFA